MIPVLTTSLLPILASRPGLEKGSHPLDQAMGRQFKEETAIGDKRAEATKVHGIRPNQHGTILPLGPGMTPLLGTTSQGHLLLHLRILGHHGLYQVPQTHHQLVTRPHLQEQHLDLLGQAHMATHLGHPLLQEHMVPLLDHLDQGQHQESPGHRQEHMTPLMVHLGQSPRLDHIGHLDRTQLLPHHRLGDHPDRPDHLDRMVAQDPDILIHMEAEAGDQAIPTWQAHRDPTQRRSSR